MPRIQRRQRVVYCDCLDCAEVASAPPSHAWEAAAKQLPPPKSLVLLLEGFNAPGEGGGGACALDALALPHFDNVARNGVTFCLAERRTAPGACVCARR